MPPRRRSTDSTACCRLRWWPSIGPRSAYVPAGPGGGTVVVPGADTSGDGLAATGATMPVIAISAGAALLALGGVLLARRRRSLS